MDWKNKLIEEYPALFRDKEDRQSYCGFHTGPGWQPILKTLCLYLDYERSELEKRMLLEKEQGLDTEELEHILANTSWPVIRQIKEKYGTLRFYCNHTTSEHNHYIDFAESLSGSVCEECGKPGTTGAGKRGWIKTLCDDCRANLV